MVNLDINQIVTQLQSTMSDSAIRQTIVKQAIYRASNLLSVGTKVIPEVPVNTLDGIFTWPSEMDEVEEVSEGVEGKEDSIEWSKYTFGLKKFRKSFVLTDEATYRGIENLQNVTSMQRTAEAFAKKKDKDILGAIVAACSAAPGYTVAVAAGKEWNSGGASVDIVGNIIAARKVLMKYSNVNELEIKNLALLVGTDVSSNLMELNLINNVQQSIESYLKTAYGITLYESRDTALADTAVLMVPGQMTGKHLVFSAPNAKLVESQRKMGVGDKYMVTQYFQTKLEPRSEADATSMRCCSITNVTA